MSRLLARIMLAVFMLPVATLVYIIVCAVLYEQVFRRREELSFLVSGLVTYAFVAGYWLLLWRRSVRWTRLRVLGSLGLALGALGAGAGVLWAVGLLDEEFGTFLLGPTVIFTWLLGTVFLWRETARERAGRLEGRAGTAVVCPACGYNLTGLGRTTCPECGASYTIDELLASQPGREDTELDRAAA